MRSASRTSQVSIRIDDEMADWIDRRVPEGESRAQFVRDLLKEEMRREREEALRAMFDRAADELTTEDLEERERGVAVFPNRA